MLARKPGMDPRGVPEREVKEMATDLKEAMTSGVLVDVQDERQNSLAQAVYVDWRGRPVPHIGDTMCCDAVCLASGMRQRVRGVVRERHFDVQTDSHGEAVVWLRVVMELLDTQPTASIAAGRPYRARFSAN